jgi:hypothetical protein
MHTENSNSLPLLITDEECLARAVFCPYHVRKTGGIKPAAFKAPPNRNDVSVNRLIAVDCNTCKLHSQKIRNPGSFKGFAVIIARAVRESHSEVQDSRALYFGHADIIHDMVLMKDEPPPAEFNLKLRNLATASKYFPDPNPEIEGWTGEDFSFVS